MLPPPTFPLGLWAIFTVGWACGTHRKKGLDAEICKKLFIKGTQGE